MITDRSPKLNHVEVASLKSPSMTETPTTPGKHYSNVVHYDIGFRSVKVYCGVNYYVLFINKETRTDIIQLIKILKPTSLLTTSTNLFI